MSDKLEKLECGSGSSNCNNCYYGGDGIIYVYYFKCQKYITKLCFYCISKELRNEAENNENNNNDNELPIGTTPGGPSENTTPGGGLWVIFEIFNYNFNCK